MTHSSTDNILGNMCREQELYYERASLASVFSASDLKVNTGSSMYLVARAIAHVFLITLLVVEQ